MSKRTVRRPTPPPDVDLPPVVPPSVVPAPAETELQSHPPIVSPAFEQANDRMKLASKPNDGQPLLHRDRGKAGRKG